MRTAARARLLEIATRGDWVEFEQAADEWNDPELTELAIVAGLATRLFNVRALELCDDEAEVAV